MSIRKAILPVLTLLVGIGLASLVPYGGAFRLVKQLAILNAAALLSYRLLQPSRPGDGFWASPLALPMAFGAGVLGSVLVDSAVYQIADPTFNIRYFTFALLVNALVFSLSAAVLEEALYRGPLVLLAHWKRVQRWMPLLIAGQAVLFAYHHHSPHRLPQFYVAVSALGLALGLAAAHWRSLWFAIGLHAGMNLIGALVTGVRYRPIADYPGVLSFDAPGNAVKITAAAVMPLLTLVWLIWQGHRQRTHRPAPGSADRP